MVTTTVGMRLSLAWFDPLWYPGSRAGSVSGMAATVLIKEWNGASGGQVGTDKTSGTVRFKTADDKNVDLNNPMVKPSSGTNWSFQKWLRLNVSVAPSGNIANPKFYTDGTQSNTGVIMYAKTTNPGAYATPVLETAATGYTDAFTYTSGSPKAIDVANAGPYTGTGDIADFLKLAMAIDSTVSAPGTLTGETMTFQWDET